jgi:hypothetical protein
MVTLCTAPRPPDDVLVDLLDPAYPPGVQCYGWTAVDDAELEVADAVSIGPRATAAARAVLDAARARVACAVHPCSP